MFTPNQVLPDQTVRGPTDEGERRLAVAMLEAAADDLARFHAIDSLRGRRLYYETLGYVLSNDVSWPYSFVRLCHALNIDVTWMRRALLRKYRRLDG